VIDPWLLRQEGGRRLRTNSIQFNSIQFNSIRSHPRIINPAE
jgi:hypothetical protein